MHLNPVKNGTIYLCPPIQIGAPSIKQRLHMRGLPANPEMKVWHVFAPVVPSVFSLANTCPVRVFPIQDPALTIAFEYSKTCPTTLPLSGQLLITSSSMFNQIARCPAILI